MYCMYLTFHWWNRCSGETQPRVITPCYSTQENSTQLVDKTERRLLLCIVLDVFLVK